jgi:hypothetical protein
MKSSEGNLLKIILILCVFTTSLVMSYGVYKIATIKPATSEANIFAKSKPKKSKKIEPYYNVCKKYSDSYKIVKKRRDYYKNQVKNNKEYFLSMDKFIPQIGSWSEVWTFHNPSIYTDKYYLVDVRSVKDGAMQKMNSLMKYYEQEKKTFC